MVAYSYTIQVPLITVVDLIWNWNINTLILICRWIWLYYLNPVSWILYGQVTSQLGDVTSVFTNLDGTVRRFFAPHE